METDNPHFATVATWKAGAAILTFQPRVPTATGGRSLQSLRVYVRDHKLRPVAMQHRTLEAHYGDFALSQSRPGAETARNWRLARDGRPIQIGGHPGYVYELGPEPPPDDIDGRSSAVVTWADGDLHLLVTSDRLEASELLRIGASIYPPRAKKYYRSRRFPKP